MLPRAALTVFPLPETDRRQRTSLAQIPTRALIVCLFLVGQLQLQLNSSSNSAPGSAGGPMTQLAPAPSPSSDLAPEPAHAPPTRKLSFQHVRALLVLNALYFGVVALGAGYAFMNPAVQAELTRAAVDAFSPSGGSGALVQAYLNGALLAAIVMTFVVNLVIGSLVFLTRPSAGIPFAAFCWAFTERYSGACSLHRPSPTSSARRCCWQMPTILDEGEAYIVAMLGVWLWWHAVFSRPGARWSA